VGAGHDGPGRSRDHGRRGPKSFGDIGEEHMRLMADPEHLRRDAGRVRVAELLERLDLVDAARMPASTYSGGMRRRLDLAMTLVGSPR
jgi:ABC-2 type transport system ATP-binding protein